MKFKNLRPDPIGVIGVMVVVLGACAAWAGEGEVLLHRNGFWSYRPFFDEPTGTPEGWRGVNFDDGGWLRDMGPVYGKRYDRPRRGGRYGTVPEFPLFYVRGKFSVSDPSGMSGVTLSVSFRGGVVAYLNGREVLRENLPEGDIRPDTPAGKPPASGGVLKAGPVEIEPALLRKGLNVLAVEVHAPPRPHHKSKRKRRNAWIRLGACGVELRGRGGGTVVSNTARPKGLQVWNADTMRMISDVEWGDPHVPLAPVRVVGARGGGYSGQVVVGCDKPLKGLRVTPGSLSRTGGKETIEARRIRVRFPQATMTRPGFMNRPGLSYLERMCFWTLQEKAPAEVPVSTRRPPKPRKGKKPGPAPSFYSWGAVQPVWLTVEVPPDAAPGDYRGRVRIEAEGHPGVDIPLEARVVGWRLPDTGAGRSFMEFYQSPETLALYYKTPLWSDRNWELIERTFRMLGKAGNRVVHIPLICKTGFGNEQSMIRWVPKSTGGYDYDLSIVDRYLDLAIEHMGRPWVIDFIVYSVLHPPSGGHPSAYHNKRGGHTYVSDYDNPKTAGRLFVRPSVTVLDSVTGKVSQLDGPLYSDEAGLVKFWRPLIETLGKRMKERGLEDVVQLGHCTDLTPAPTVGAAWGKLWPGKRWVTHAHSPGATWKAAQKWVPGHDGGYCSAVYQFDRVPLRSMIGRSRVKATDVFGWMRPRDTRINAKFARELLRCRSTNAVLLLPHQRLCQERAISAGAHGRGAVGADYFPAMRDRRGRTRMLFGRYPQTNWAYTGWDGNVLAPGPDGALSTTTFDAIREGMQECEAKIFIETALMDDSKKAGLGADLVERCWRVLDARRQVVITLFRQLRRECHVFTPDIYLDFGWQKRSEELYSAAAEVAGKVGGSAE